MKPRDIVRFLDQHVVGQDDAKRTLAVAIYSHYRRLTLPGMLAPNKANVLLIGPTGTGKTLLCTTLARALDLPQVMADATALAQSRYVGEELDALMVRLIERAGGDLEKAGRGIVFIDEIDKLAADPERAGAGRAVQHALLKIMEGSLIRLADGRTVDTRQMLFICGGAFVGIERIMQERRAYGFIGTSPDDDPRIIERLNTRIKPTDLFEYGLIPEFTGRLPIIAQLHGLDRAALIRIMQEPQDSLYRQFQALFALDGAALSIAPPVFAQLADLALEFKVGARSLRGLFEELLGPVLYALPDEAPGTQFHFDSLFAAPKKTIAGQAG